MSAYSSRDGSGEGWAGFAAVMFLGALLGITLAALNAVIALLSVGAYPIWSLVILALDGVVIYALTAHGDAFATTG
jgi:hypothetical protein